MILRDPVWPGLPLSAIDGDALVRQLGGLLDDAERWRLLSDDDGIAVSVGRTPGCPCKAYRSVVTLPGTLEKVVRLIADEMFERLGEWTAQFQEGEVLRVLEDTETGKGWLMRVFYATPKVLSNREYLYYLGRRRVANGQVVIVYCSVDDPGLSPRAGYVRGALFPSVHRCTRMAAGATRLEHILATDVGGSVPVWVQNHVFAGELAAAMRKDAESQRRLFQKA